jgi:hypothetical protein
MLNSLKWHTLAELSTLNLSGIQNDRLDFEPDLRQRTYYMIRLIICPNLNRDLIKYSAPTIYWCHKEPPVVKHHEEPQRPASLRQIKLQNQSSSIALIWLKKLTYYVQLLLQVSLPKSLGEENDNIMERRCPVMEGSNRWRTELGASVWRMTNPGVTTQSYTEQAVSKQWQHPYLTFKKAEGLRWWVDDLEIQRGEKEWHACECAQAW